MTFAMIHSNTRSIGLHPLILFENDGHEVIRDILKRIELQNPCPSIPALEYFATHNLKPDDETTLYPHKRGFFCGSFAYGMACSCFR
jgi:hypothetical protein